MISLFADFLCDVDDSLDSRLSLFRWNNPCAVFLRVEKTSNHAIEQLRAISSSYKTLISLSRRFRLFSAGIIGLDMFLLCLRRWRKGNCVCDLYRIILSIANQVNVPCFSLQHDATSFPSLLHITSDKINCKRLTLSIACETLWEQMIWDFSRVTFTINANLPFPSLPQTKVMQSCYCVNSIYFLLCPLSSSVGENLQINCSLLSFSSFFRCRSQYLFKTHRTINPTFREIIKRFNLSIFIRKNFVSKELYW